MDQGWMWRGQVLAGSGDLDGWVVRRKLGSKPLHITATVARGGGITLSLPKAHHAGGRRGKERAARHERSSDWRRGAAGSPDPDELRTTQAAHARRK
jgi:hypothetical protein